MSTSSVDLYDLFSLVKEVLIQRFSEVFCPHGQTLQNMFHNLLTYTTTFFLDI